MVSYKTTYRRRRARSSRRKNVKSRKMMKGGGTIKNGILNTVSYAYDGDYILENRKPHGKGKFFNKVSGESYSGDFVNGKKEGKGKMTSYGKKFVGNWRNDQPHGKGLFVYEQSEKTYSYSGDFVNGNKEGKGIMKFQYGTRFDGIWKNNLPIGKGIIILKDGTRKQGEYAAAEAVDDDDRKSKASTPDVSYNNNISFINGPGPGPGDGDGDGVYFDNNDD